VRASSPSTNLRGCVKRWLTEKLHKSQLRITASIIGNLRARVKKLRRNKDNDECIFAYLLRPNYKLF
jgi:hypothetical protein